VKVIIAYCPHLLSRGRVSLWYPDLWQGKRFDERRISLIERLGLSKI